MKKSFLYYSILNCIVTTKYYFLYTHEYYPAQSEVIANFEADKVFQKGFSC